MLSTTQLNSSSAGEWLPDSLLHIHGGAPEDFELELAPNNELVIHSGTTRGLLTSKRCDHSRLIVNMEDYSAVRPSKSH